MWYAIIAEDKKNSLELRLKTRPDHLQNIQALVNQGRVLVAGPHPAIDAEDPGSSGFTGSLIIAEFNSLEDAQEWAFNDPYYKAGVFENITVKPFRKVLP